MFQVKVFGFDELNANLQSIAREFRPQAGIVGSMEEGAWAIALEARDNVVRRGLIDTYALHDSIKPKKVNQFRIDVEVGVIYGAIHEFGGRIPITRRSRGFFWAMFRKTGDLKWKYMALSRKSHFVMPARPYLRPALDTAKDRALSITAREIRKRLERAVN